MVKEIKSIIRKALNNSLEPKKAYDLWADIYDLEEDNLVFKMEGEILDALMRNLDLKGKFVLDYGCGTGRNWARLLSYNIEKIIGCDLSPNMLKRLKEKYQGYEAYLIKKNQSLPVKANSIDLIFSTLVAAQLKDIKAIFIEWNGLLKPGGLILMTDLHPEILKSGGRRTFVKEGKIYEVKNYVHSIEKIRSHCRDLNFEIIDLKEKYIGEDAKIYYEKKNALHIYQKFYGMPLVYGILARKNNDLIKS